MLSRLEAEEFLDQEFVLARRAVAHCHAIVIEPVSHLGNLNGEHSGVADDYIKSSRIRSRQSTRRAGHCRGGGMGWSR